MEITLDQLKEYNNQGYLSFPNLFDSEYISKVNQVIDTILLTLKPSETVFDENNTGKIKQIQYLFNYDPIFTHILDKLYPIAQEITGEKELELLNMQLFEKHPHISKPTRAHQDNAYFQMTPPIAVTFWISLDNINEENGALYYTVGSHKMGYIPHDRYHPTTTFRKRSGVSGLSMCIHSHNEEDDLIMITKPGDVLVHNCNLVHRAGKNNSETKRRRAIGVVYIPKVCKKDPVLVEHYKEQLVGDIEYQKEKDMKLYLSLIESIPL